MAALGATRVAARPRLSYAANSTFYEFRRVFSQLTTRAAPQKIKQDAVEHPRKWTQDAYRHFSSSALAFAVPTRPVFNPRWLNRKDDADDTESSDTSHDREPQEEGSVPSEGQPSSSLDGAGEESSSGSSEDSTSPVSSSSDEASDSGSPDPPPPPPDNTSSSPNVPTKLSVPEVYPQVLALPISRRPLFPGFYKALVVRDPIVVAAIKDMIQRGQPYIGAFLLKNGDSDSDTVKDLDSVHRVGVFAQITSVFAVNSGKDDKEDTSGLTIVLYPHRRIKIKELVKHSPIEPTTATVTDESPTEAREGAVADQTPQQCMYPQASPGFHLMTRLSFLVAMHTHFLRNHPGVSIVNVENMEPELYEKDNHYIRAVMSEIVSVFKDIAQINPLFRDQITAFSASQLASSVFEEPDKLADFAAAVSTGEVGELQEVLESMQVDDRLQKALVVLKKELINAQLQSKISRDVDSKIAKRQREYYLMEQLRMIKKELGMESDGKDKLIEKFKERANELRMPEVARKVFDEELSKLMHLEPQAFEFNITRNYLDWLTQVCWPSYLAYFFLMSS
jgi:ATP-dependent Lon protease